MCYDSEYFPLKIDSFEDLEKKTSRYHSKVLLYWMGAAIYGFLTCSLCCPVSPTFIIVFVFFPVFELFFFLITIIYDYFLFLKFKTYLCFSFCCVFCGKMEYIEKNRFYEENYVDNSDIEKCDCAKMNPHWIGFTIVYAVIFTLFGLLFCLFVQLYRYGDSYEANPFGNTCLAVILSISVFPFVFLYFCCFVVYIPRQILFSTLGYHIETIKKCGIKFTDYFNIRRENVDLNIQVNENQISGESKNIELNEIQIESVEPIAESENIQTIVEIPNRNIKFSMFENSRNILDFVYEEACCICMDNKSEIVFSNCGHLCTCEECSKKIEKCPLCRKSFDQKSSRIVSKKVLIQLESSGKVETEFVNEKISIDEKKKKKKKRKKKRGFRISEKIASIRESEKLVLSNKKKNKEIYFKEIISFEERKIGERKIIFKLFTKENSYKIHVFKEETAKLFREFLNEQISINSSLKINALNQSLTVSNDLFEKK